MGKKNMKIFYTKKSFKISKSPKIINGTDIGYNLSELKKLSIEELKNILNLIYIYFTQKSRQKNKNSQFKILYQRVKKELKERIKEDEKMINQNKNCFITPIEKMNFPNFINDKPIYMKINSSKQSSSNIFGINNQNSLREKINRMELEKQLLLYEIYTIKSKIIEYNIEEEKINIQNNFNNNNLNNIENNIFSTFPIKKQDFDLESEMDIFLNSEANSKIKIKGKKERINE
jgi:hypothetical protein